MQPAREALRGQSQAAIAGASSYAVDAVEAVGDTYASADYRLHLAQIMTRRTLLEALNT